MQSCKWADGRKKQKELYKKEMCGFNSQNIKNVSNEQIRNTPPQKNPMIQQQMLFLKLQKEHP